MVNRRGRLLLNLHLNSYLPLEYNLEMQEGGGTSPTMERRLHDIIFARNGLLFFSTCSVRLCTITDMHNKKLVRFCKAYGVHAEIKTDGSKRVDRSKTIDSR